MEEVLYSQILQGITDATIWTAPWDLSSHLDYPSILIDLPHHIPLPNDDLVNDVICDIQMYASTTYQHQKMVPG